MKKLVSVLLVLAMILSLGMTAMAEATISENALIGIILPTKEESRWLNDQKYFEQYFGDLNYEILFSQNNSATEKTNVETLISRGAEVIVLCAYDAAAAAAAVNSAKEEGIVVISYDRLIMGTPNLDYYVTFDSRSVGQAQADYLIQQAEGKTGVNLQPYIADGTFIVRNCDKAVEYMDNGDLTRDEMIAIMQTIDSEWNMATCKALAEAHLTAAGSDAKGEVFVLGPADDDCCRALSDAFSADAEVETLVITGADGVEASVQYIIDGKQSMTVYKDSQALVTGTLAIIEALKAGEEPATDTTYNNDAMDVPTVQADVVTVTADNIAEVFFATGVYDGSKFTGWN
ncbi:MAG: substrate-binding domain-containing protein [Clostridia bacterium]|nr:substrate-binding domain-containing protein [Clostridia bacterium]